MSGWSDFGDVLSGGASFLGSALGFIGQRNTNRANRDLLQQANIFSARQAQTNRDFQERMSSTSWQRGVADMKLAGINPMLSVSQGGASAPSGNSAQGISQANQQNEMQSFANSARDSLMLNEQIKQIRAQTSAANMQAVSSASNAAYNSVRSQLEEYKIPEAQLGAKVATSQWGMAAHLAERYGVNMNTALSLVKMFKGGGSLSESINGNTGVVTTHKSKTW